MGAAVYGIGFGFLALVIIAMLIFAEEE